MRRGRGLSIILTFSHQVATTSPLEPKNIVQLTIAPCTPYFRIRTSRLCIMSTEAPAPRLRIRRATPDDAGTIANIHFEAFGPGVMNKLMHPDGGSEDARAKFAGGIFPPPDKAAGSSTEVIVMVAELLAEGSQAEGG
ncbi:hypothetical protein FJTKL_12971 [Diaporthe vaccinii]|uniref:Acetyltransferase n=1 Tax=Diaporthe vaccinii TaxID=105482 RepID=A0ABR4EC57_9PEZI